MGTEETEVSPELQQVLWACYTYCQGEPVPVLCGKKHARRLKELRKAGTAEMKKISWQ